MYEPAEDSELLAHVVQKYARGTVLDLGTGSGVLARIAHEKGLRVLAVDIDQNVVQSLRHEPFRVKCSDRFLAVKGKFDTIICNPPYLPNDEEVIDQALHGGKKGYEYIVSVLAQAKYHLQANGQCLFLISTLTKPAVVEKVLRQEGYEWSIVSRQKLFMEELLVYRATLALGIPAQFLGKGKRSLVYAVKNTAVKVSTELRATKEARMLQIVNKKKIGPRFLAVRGNQLVMQRIVGKPFNEFIKTTHNKTVLREYLRQCYILDTLGIAKQECGRPGKNVLVTKNKTVVLLDFERALFSNKVHNLTQASTWAARFLQCEIRSELTRYKKEPGVKHFRAVLRALRL